MMSFNCVKRFKSGVSKKLARSKRRSSLHSRPRGVEVLESRELLATFTVTNLQNSGAGSLRQAIIESNERPGADTIDFGVAGTIRIWQDVAPRDHRHRDHRRLHGPVVRGIARRDRELPGYQGLRFATGADGSILRSLSLVKAGNAGVTLNASNVTVQGNYIGLLADGKTVAGNRGDGVRINASSHGDLIGQINPVTSVSYYNADVREHAAGLGLAGHSRFRHERPVPHHRDVGRQRPAVRSGRSPASAARATPSTTRAPRPRASTVPTISAERRCGWSAATGPATAPSTASSSRGRPPTSRRAATTGRSIIPTRQYTYVHSTMGDLAVGNADGPEGNAPIGTGHAFLYERRAEHVPDRHRLSGLDVHHGLRHLVQRRHELHDLRRLHRASSAQGETIGQGYLVDYDSATGQFTHWTSFADPNGLVGQDFVTHFEGISSTETGVYTLSADSVQSGSSTILRRARG